MYHGNRHRIAGGFFGNLFHAVGGIAKGVVGGFLGGGPVGAIKGAVTGAVSATRGNIARSTLEAGGSGSAYTPALRAAHARAVASHASNPIAGSSAGTPGGAMVLAGGGPRMAMLGAGGGGGGGGGARRRMRWTNTKALGRAERRIHSAVKHMTKYIKWVHAKKEGHAAPKFRKRKR